MAPTTDTNDGRNDDGSAHSERATRPAPVGYVVKAAATEPESSRGAAATTAAPLRRRQDGLEWREREMAVRGSLPGDRYILIARHVHATHPSAQIEVTTAHEPAPPSGRFGRGYQRFKQLLIGRPIASSQAIHERLTKVKALAVLSSDALSSTAYATEEILLILALVGGAALGLSVPIAIAIVVLLGIVAFSYRQTIHAYPSGGGSYIVASANLGRIPGLTAAASLMIDYVLTVSVSIAAGVAALTAAVPRLQPYTVPIGLLCIVLLTVGNLRGVRESGTIFAAPTYLFLVSMLVMIVLGLIKVFVLHDPAATGVPRDPIVGTHALSVFIILRAFSSGCTAMTGTEAISNGVPAFQKPESQNAATTLMWMAGLLGAMFLGVTILAHQYGLAPRPNDTILSQLAREVVGAGPAYYVIQAGTLLVLVLAANTSYADFPRLASILARDRFLPRLFAFRGDRLAFSVGIGALSVFAGALVVMFGGNVNALIPLYAVGVFISFTLSQGGMVLHWWRERGSHWATKAAVNGVGALATGVVALIIGATKLISGEPLFRLGSYNIHAGAWMVLVLIPLLIASFAGIREHYDHARHELATETPLSPEAIRHTVVVPIATLSRVALQTLAYARSLSDNVTAVHVTDDPEEIASLSATWRAQTETVPFLRDTRLVVIESSYRALTAPLLAYLDEIDRHGQHDTLTVILPEFVPSRWWEQLLHNQTALRLKGALLFRPGTVVISVPYHLRRAARRRDATDDVATK